jgi:hypothetical protein
VLANGEVIWKQEAEKGGEFGIKFTDLDQRSAGALERIITLGGKVPMAQEAGARVRLHIDGLGSPMRARVRDASKREVTVGSELGFLQVGKNLDLEDAETGDKRPAHIDRVEVEIDPESRIPRLVVALRYDDAEESVPVEVATPKEDDRGREDDVLDRDMATESSSEKEEMPEDAPATEKNGAAARPQAKAKSDGGKLPAVIARGAAKIGPAIGDVAKRARTALAMLAAKRFGKKEAVAARRTTAPPPGGALHASGRKVVRAQDLLDAPPAKKPLAHKRRIAAGAAVGVAAITAWALLHRSPAPQPAAAANDTPAVQSAAPIEPAPSALAPTSNLPPLLPANATSSPPIVAPPPPATADRSHPIKVTPFGNPSVNHGNVLRLKMDGPIEKINGATQATGFLVTIPGRKSIEPAAPLAARDARIASIKVSNETGGAELNVTFKDGVPNYQVRARGDDLEIVLAPPGKLEDAKKTQPKGHEAVAHHQKSHKK